MLTTQNVNIQNQRHDGKIVADISLTEIGSLSHVSKERPGN